MFLKPAEGRKVADPDRNDTLPAEGREVEFNQYWQRRVADGDVVEASRPTEVAGKAAAKKE